MVQASDRETGITYGALIGLVLAISAVLALTGSAGYFLAKSSDQQMSDPLPATLTTTTQITSVSAPTSTVVINPTAPTIAEAAANPFAVK
jgi:hypothetical protein